jgi:hypothetical protein
VRLRIRGKSWTITEAPIDEYGNCSWSERRIEIRPNQRPANRLDTLVHELLHALYPEMREREVRTASGVLTEALFKDGWRRT